MSNIHEKIDALQRSIGEEIDKAYEEGKLVGRADAIEEMVKPLQFRCYVLSRGLTCQFCPMECTHRPEECLKEQKDDSKD